MAAENPLKTEKSSSNDTIFLNCLTGVFGAGGGEAAAMLIAKNDFAKEVEW